MRLRLASVRLLFLPFLSASLAALPRKSRYRRAAALARLPRQRTLQYVWKDLSQRGRDASVVGQQLQRAGGHVA